MNKRRTLLFALVATSLAAPFACFAQDQKKVWRIGYIDAGSRKSLVDSGRHSALIDGMREHGYIEGKNFILEARYAEGKTNRLEGFAKELVGQKVDLLLTLGAVETPAAQQATSTIPIVVLNTTDPVGNRFAASLARPGGNITGMSSGADETVEKLLELLIVAVPKVTRVAVLVDPANMVNEPLLARIESAARRTGKVVIPFRVRTPEEIERSFTVMARERVDALIVLIDPFFLQQRAQITALALKHKLPSIFPRSEYVDVGGLMSYGADYYDNYRHAATFIDKIFKGTKPGEIPFEQPTRFYLVINRKTANALGVKISGELLTRADKIIE